MEAIFALAVGIMAGAGIYLILRGRTWPVVIGLSLLGYAVNVFIFAMGRLWLDAAPILGAASQVADPLPQALVLTAIVIGFAMTAFLVVLAIRARAELGHDEVDLQKPNSRGGA